MSGFLLLLVKVNLAMGAAIVLVSLMRRPLRAQFGAPIAYALWLLVPIASVAVLLPPREVPPPAHIAFVQAPAAPAPAIGYVPQSSFDAIEQMARHDAIMPPAPVKPSGSSYEMFDTARLIFAAWMLGLLMMAVYLARVQIRFSAAVRRGQAGPAVLGFFRPRIVTPANFQEQFTPQEQLAILAHERVHLARQDARINALVALLRCACWFNPLIHLGARCLRIDQELACDAAAVSGAISRRDYSMALLKSQVMVGVLPFGCNWPGPQHPLVERIALLQRKPPGTARRLAGAGIVVLAATSAGLGAWAAQPAVVDKAVIAEQPSMAGSSLAATGPTQDQTIRNAGLGQPVAPASPSDSGKDAETSTNVRARGTTPTPPVVLAQTPNSITTTDAQANAPASTNSIAAKPVPKEVSVPEISVASNDLSAAPVLPTPNAAPVVAFNDQHGGPTRDLSIGQSQKGPSTLPAALPNFDPNKPYETSSCTGVVTGRVSSSTTIQTPRIVCGHMGGDEFSGGYTLNIDACKRPRTWWEAEARASMSMSVDLASCANAPWRTVTLQFADLVDAGKMSLGKLVTLKGDFRLIIQNKVQYLLMQNAKVLYTDSFERSVPEQIAMIERPKPLANVATAPKNAITPSKIAPASVTGTVPNDPPAARIPPTPNASPVVALSDQPVRQPITRDLSAGPVQARLSTPTYQKLDMNQPYTITMCHDLDRAGVMKGRVTSSTTIQVSAFGCARTSSGTGEAGGGGDGYPMVFNGCKSQSDLIPRPGGGYCPIKTLLTITALFANPADASKMPLGKLATLKGDPFVITQNNLNYLGLKNARFLYADPFGR